MAVSRRINAYALEHPWRLALIGFLFFVLLSTLMLVVFHRNFFSGLFGAYGVILGSATAWSARRHGGRLAFYQKAAMLLAFVVGFLILGLLLQGFGLLPR
jgi:hypothetical protein